MAINAPTVHPRTTSPHPYFAGARLVIIACPHCHQMHSHGILDGDTLAHRHSHCHKGNGYYIATEQPA